ncbi:ABC transporter permease [Amycolatopsis sp. NBC_01480]|jgi:lipooligosaccharide transport system permease protein|uniref:ABC transporter permease n=1 Tax=Amycolatopsis sp. NBC_01480 TaxID=2903562 RepID=UPI002E2BE222|nr:ABC transporter permease [Amycolatopsis sp. NBC_01480]
MTAPATGRVVGRWHGAWLRVEGHWTWYRRYWLATLYSTGLQPVLFLAAMGLGFGSQVQAGPATGGLSYLQYVAPALLVAGSAQMGVSDSSYPVLSGFKWQKDYLAVTATPVSPGQVLGGHLIWGALKLTLAGSIYALVAVFFGAWANFGALAVILVGTLTGLACSAPMTALAAKTFDEGTRFGLIFRFVVIPMTLFSGTFFPITQIPLYLRWLAWISPLWHGTQLSRAVTLGGVGTWPAVGHAAYLAVLVLGGWALAHRFFGQRLVN